MVWLKYGGSFLLAIIIESNFSRFYAIGGHTPDLFIILVIYISLHEGKIKGTISGFSVGLIQDLIISVGFLGLSAFTKSLSGFLIGYFTDSKRSRKFPGILVPVGIGILINTVFENIFRSAGSSEGILFFIATKGFPSAIYTFILAFIIFIIVKPREDLN